MNDMIRYDMEKGKRKLRLAARNRPARRERSARSVGAFLMVGEGEGAPCSFRRLGGLSEALGGHAYPLDLSPFFFGVKPAAVDAALPFAIGTDLAAPSSWIA